MKTFHGVKEMQSREEMDEEWTSRVDLVSTLI
jgi:hypothetical protein